MVFLFDINSFSSVGTNPVSLRESAETKTEGVSKLSVPIENGLSFPSTTSVRSLFSEQAFNKKVKIIIDIKSFLIYDKIGIKII